MRSKFITKGCVGPLKACQSRNPKLTSAEWYRAQMREWAGLWRGRRWIAAILGKPVEEVAKTYLGLAKSYREESLKRAAVELISQAAPEDGLAVLRKKTECLRAQNDTLADIITNLALRVDDLERNQFTRHELVLINPEDLLEREGVL
jgi:hypothetical protein